MTKREALEYFEELGRKLCGELRANGPQELREHLWSARQIQMSIPRQPGSEDDEGLDSEKFRAGYEYLLGHVRVTTIMDTVSWRPKRYANMASWDLSSIDPVDGKESAVRKSGSYHVSRDPLAVAKRIARQAGSSEFARLHADFTAARARDRAYSTKTMASAALALRGVPGLSYDENGEANRIGVDRTLLHENCNVRRTYVYTDSITFESLSVPPDIANKIFRLIMKRTIL